MENGRSGAHKEMCKIMGNHQLVIITRLLEVIETMTSIDELFVWLADMMMQRMDVQVIQFWAMQNYRSGRVSCELRTTVQQGTSLPQHIVINQLLADTVERLLNKRQSVEPQTVSNLFSQYFSNLLLRYNLNYWACNSLSNNILLAPADNDFSCEKVATPLTLAVTIFAHHTPSSRLLPTISHILEHVLAVAKNHKLLEVTQPVGHGLQLTGARQATNRSLLTEFIPHRTQIVSMTKRHALLENEAFIPDKNARRLYLEIDEKKNVGELVYTTQLSTQEFYAALCLLLAQKRIQLFEGRRHSEQKLVDSFVAPRTTG